MLAAQPAFRLPARKFLSALSPLHSPAPAPSLCLGVNNRALSIGVPATKGLGAQPWFYICNGLTHLSQDELDCTQPQICVACGHVRENCPNPDAARLEALKTAPLNHSPVLLWYLLAGLMLLAAASAAATQAAGSITAYNPPSATFTGLQRTDRKRAPLRSFFLKPVLFLFALNTKSKRAPLVRLSNILVGGVWTPSAEADGGLAFSNGRRHGVDNFKGKSDVLKELVHKASICASSTLTRTTAGDRLLQYLGPRRLSLAPTQGAYPTRSLLSGPRFDVVRKILL
ncbi:hypothetical protein C8F04DRAFT_1176971 [Mycena alexandri]|uniref:Uncharacterized protein n=1 Tax=Mycena alexandri TaxID=1745969 RepID=A0AAD6X745_9AGAR|nr:hypothetical protein C8F04DRAFT_1176971 [Mycena alexandri]